MNCLLPGIIVGSSPGLAAPNGMAPDLPRNGDVVELLEKARDAGQIPIIVELDLPYVAESQLDEAAVREQRAAIAAAQQRVLDRVAARSDAVANVTRYETVPQLALTVDAQALSALVDHPDVARIEEDVTAAPSAPGGGLGAPQ